MEFSIDIHTELNGDILIEDYSKEYGQYLDEDMDVVTSYDYYKYSQSATLNAIMKVNINSITLKDILLNEHKEDLDSCLFKVDKDGYYVIEHIILPTKAWYDAASEDYKLYYGTIYIVDNEKLYKEIVTQQDDGSIVRTLEECTAKEIMERNIEGTTIKKCRIDVFFTGNLQQCYINYCKQIFEALLTKCSTQESSDASYARDFIWMTLNIIDYLVGFKQFMEAQRIIENFFRCGGFCEPMIPFKPKISHCGCS